MSLKRLPDALLLVLASVFFLVLVLFFYSRSLYVGWLVKLLVFGLLFAVLIIRELKTR